MGDNRETPSHSLKRPEPPGKPRRDCHGPREVRSCAIHGNPGDRYPGADADRRQQIILSGNEIKLQHEAGTIVIEPWDDARVNPNSYNVSLAPELMVYTEACLDPRQDNRTRTITIPEEGLVLTPGKLYLGRTNEWTETYGLVPKLEGRSSIGRLGLFIHVTAGYGDVGFRGYWTLEIVAVEPVRIYPNMEIGQLSYHPVCGEVVNQYQGKYQDSREVVASQIWREMQ